MSEHDFKNGQPTFCAESIKRMIEKKPYVGGGENMPSSIGVFVDPSAGGGFMSIISVCHINKDVVICGIDVQIVEDMKQSKKLFHNHIKKLIQNKWTRCALVVLFYESDLGNESNHFAEILSRFHNTAFFAETKLVYSLEEYYKNTYFLTTRARKNECISCLRRALVQDRVFFSDTCASSNLDVSDADALTHQKNQLEYQLLSFKNRVNSSGKFWSGMNVDDQQPNDCFQDDGLAIILAFAVSINVVISNNPIPEWISLECKRSNDLIYKALE
jgi:hypothetical protein